MVMFPFRLGRFHALLLLAMLTVDACLCKRGAGRNKDMSRILHCYGGL